MFDVNGSIKVSSNEELQGNFIEANLNILSPNLIFECATLSLDSNIDIPIGHTSLAALGPSGCYFTSYQIP